MNSAPATASRPLLHLRNLSLCTVTLLGLTGCLEDKKTKTELEQMRQQNHNLTRQLQQAQVDRANAEAQLKATRAELDKLKTVPPPATVARSGAPAPVATPTGPAPVNLPYSLYTGIITTTKGEDIELGSVNFGNIDRVPLLINNGNVEVSMGKVKYIRRKGKPDAANTFPVSVVLSNGEEVSCRLQADKIQGVDPRFGSKVEIPFGTVIELQFK
jgi:hypothetical protein